MSLQTRRRPNHRMAASSFSRCRTAITILPLLLLTILINRWDHQGSIIDWPTEEAEGDRRRPTWGVRRRCRRCRCRGREGCSRHPGPSGCSMTFTRPLRPSMTQQSSSNRSNRKRSNTSSSGWRKHPLTAEPRSELGLLASM